MTLPSAAEPGGGDEGPLPFDCQPILIRRSTVLRETVDVVGNRKRKVQVPRGRPVTVVLAAPFRSGTSLSTMPRDLTRMTPVTGLTPAAVTVALTTRRPVPACVVTLIVGVDLT